MMGDSHIAIDPAADAELIGIVGEDFRHGTLKRAGYTLKYEGPAQLPTAVWWRQGVRIGRTTLAMADNEQRANAFDAARQLVEDEGFRLVRANSASDPRWPFRMVLTAIGLLLVVVFVMGWR